MKGIKMSKNNFRPQKFYDLEIINEQSLLVGKIRVKPSGILWSPKGSHTWLGVDLKSFAAFMEETGKKQQK